jgi:hypothetical protein
MKKALPLLRHLPRGKARQKAWKAIGAPRLIVWGGKRLDQFEIHRLKEHCNGSRN